ncbi:MAG: response regulator [Nitrospiraceae bacterium]|nr:MAG: response regulator [Nitrospiraceae bacterium]
MKTILVVEDSSTTRALIRAVIDELGDFETVEASTGFEALKMLPQEEYDLIITDINMPDINGLELINFMRNNDRYRQIPIIIVSTERSGEDRKRGMALGATAYITKPFKSFELQETIKKIIGP